MKTDLKNDASNGHSEQAFNGHSIEEHLAKAIRSESMPVNNSQRVDNIMDKVFELRLQASYETRWVNLKTALLYGFAVAASISVGCIIGNLYEISKIYSATSTAGMDFISVGFGSIFLSL